MKRANGNLPGKPRKLTPSPQLAREFEVAPPVCEDWVNDVGAALFERLLPRLKGIVTQEDMPLLMNACNLFGIAVQCANEIKRDGITVPDNAGSIKKHPAWQIYREALTGFNQIVQNFGMTPASRAKHSPAAEAQTMDDYLDKLDAEAED